MTLELHDYPPLALTRMNQEHEQLAGCLNQAEQAILLGQPVLPLLRGLYTLCHEHFAQEEADMEKLGFSGLAQHRHEHQQMLGWLDDAGVTYERDGDITAVLRVLLDDIPDWFGRHMSGADRQLAQFLAGQLNG